jgi:3-dehydroquinate dehydratase/shikimate dehydrogenase
MICVSIGRSRHQQMLAEHRQLVECGAKLVELRLDYIHGEVNLKRLITDRPGPVVITCRRHVDGGKWDGREETRILLLRSAIAAGVEYIDLEDDVAALIPRYGDTKRIVSLHDFKATPPNLEEIHDRLAALDADIVKISAMANHPHDNIRMLRLIRSSSIPTIGLCMGDIGTPSRILVRKFGAPFTYATFHHERALAPGQLSFAHMTEIYHSEQVDADTVVYGVVADPVAHSLSPQVHNAALRHAGLNAVYVPFRVPAEDLDQFITDAEELDIRGLSVTIPHKEAVLKRLTKIDGAVVGVGAANTIVFQNGQLHGYNTDYRAAMDCLESALGISEDEGPTRLTGKTALVLGAGGAAKAIAYGLIRRKMEVVICGRTFERAQKLAQRLGCRAIEWPVRHTVAADVLVNCTPAGMHPNVDDTPYDSYRLKPSMVVFDTVYNPENTLLVKDARGRNCTVITGVEMFVRQASLQFQLFTGRDAPADLMRDVLKRATGSAKQVVSNKR